MLIAKGNDVCFACHTDHQEGVDSRKFTHSPVADACVNCHSPHSTDYPNNLIADPKQDLCFSCHADKKDQTQNAKVKHRGLITGEKCLACHDPHFSDNAKQLIMEPMELCMNCHSQAYDRRGARLANMAEILENNTSKHGPILEKDCSGCHDPHGSDNFRILRANFPPLFYSGYDPQNYELCFMCHEQDLAAEEATSTMTGFRNGEQNLHFVHVNKKVKGRTCRACHDAHATNNPRHIRDDVPFGNWSLSVGFSKTAAGGQCLPGCHQMFAYDRDKPVANRQ
jgi:predicted CXXCH cytochrome family protein